MHHLLTVQWTVDPPIGAQAFIDLVYVLAWNQGLYSATEEVGGVLQAQSLHIQQIDETICREQRSARTHTFDHRVGADFRSMPPSHRPAGINDACHADDLDTLAADRNRIWYG